MSKSILVKDFIVKYVFPENKDLFIEKIEDWDQASDTLNSFYTLDVLRMILDDIQ